ncbi:ABC transporter permease [Marinobacter sp. M3C]|uniref:ABC transporter permease n=1 Tax=unclassified Marinobacter TaxID=83889 RepID=UPI00200D544B|nr:MULTISPECIES: ABC transporter permease [unclassified Marinobacter]MCL1484721.1 ABC transporter permease [Marinobacter sp.]MCL1487649.1 ABC transporter permease [Marinobacter sp.]UQG57468.1 ABC transporter permease [Marinobacter sp. M4C]UQG61355.1 ABC transporter permease [Marinobacter sp. M3C]UQG66273.1 ABC transporter permease [Marinobacter sp. M2C]
MTNGGGASKPGRPPIWTYWIVLPSVLVLWALVSGLIQSPLLPSPSDVLDSLMREANSGDLWYHLSATLRRVVLAFFLAMSLGILIGLAMGRSIFINALFDPLLVLLLNLPALVTIILMYVWFGLVESAAIMAVVINKVPNVAVTVREGARSLDFRLEDMATVYRFSRWQRFRDVWVPQLFPYLMAATRGGLALIWKIVLVVELLGRSSGVGFQLQMAFQIFDVAAILAYSLAFIAVVQLIELAILQPLERRCSRWRQPEQAHA